VSPKTQAGEPGSPLSGWQARALHTITCPSGQRLKIRIPGIATLLEHGDVPDDLVELALLELTAENGATGALAADLAKSDNGKRAEIIEKIGRFGAFQRELVRAAVAAVEVAPDEWQEVHLSQADVASDALPEDDLALVAEIVQRIRAYDARGVRIGVEPLDRWAAFREAHGCPDENCEGCQKLLDELSTADVVPV
jgi:hypothetical protein